MLVGLKGRFFGELGENGLGGIKLRKTSPVNSLFGGGRAVVF